MAKASTQDTKPSEQAVQQPVVPAVEDPGVATGVDEAGHQKIQEQGYKGTKVDPRPNSDFTVAGVTKGS